MVEACLNLQRSDNAMNEDSSLVQLHWPDEVDDPVIAFLRSGAYRLLEQAIEAEVDACVWGQRRT
ncbi:hypothetical protein N826_41045 [Skermanella aerolata KACC 11604]|nr:hypothetical protein N826_41045 [Skermanella aerolata KACC 11604]